MSPRSCVTTFIARLLWGAPNPFLIAQLLGKQHGFRCLVFHDICNEPTEFTNGLGVTITSGEFERAIDFVSKYYRIVTLEEALGGDKHLSDGRPTLLITFDDAYRTVHREALPLLRERGLPAVFFVNAGLIGNGGLSNDNLMTYVYNRFGMASLSETLKTFDIPIHRKIASIGQILQEVIAPLKKREVAALNDALAKHYSFSPTSLAREADLYLHREDLRDLVEGGVDIGNHTLSHSFCRNLGGVDLYSEIETNNSILEGLVGKKVSAFSVPYGSQLDLTPRLLDCLERLGIESVFLVEGLINQSPPEMERLVRISPRGVRRDADFFMDVEIMPRLRAIRNKYITNANEE